MDCSLYTTRVNSLQTTSRRKCSGIEPANYGLDRAKPAKRWLPRSVRERADCDTEPLQETRSPSSVHLSVYTIPNTETNPKPNTVATHHVPQPERRTMEAPRARLSMLDADGSRREAGSPLTDHEPSSSPVPKPSHVGWHTADEVRPLDIGYIEDMEGALREMEACQRLFTQWKSTWNGLTSRRMSEQEVQILYRIVALEEDARHALAATEGIVQAHKSFSALMTENLRLAATTGVLALGKDLSRTAFNIQSHSRDVSNSVVGMLDKLRKLVTQVEAVNAKLQRKALWPKICTFLVRILRALAALAAVAALPIGEISASAGLVLGAIAPVATASAAMLNAYMKRRAPQNYDEAVKFLNETLPDEAEHVEMHMRAFEEYHSALQSEMKTAQGELIRMDPNEAQRASMEWEIQDVNLQLLTPRG